VEDIKEKFNFQIKNIISNILHMMNDIFSFKGYNF
jgi:hypothetical protein